MAYIHRKISGRRLLVIAYFPLAVSASQPNDQMNQNWLGMKDFIPNERDLYLKYYGVLLMSLSIFILITSNSGQIRKCIE